MLKHNNLLIMIRIIIAVVWVFISFYIAFSLSNMAILETNLIIDSFSIKYMYILNGIEHYKILYLKDFVLVFFTVLLLLITTYFNAFGFICNFCLLLFMPIGIMSKVYYKIRFNIKYKNQKCYLSFFDGLIKSSFFGMVTLHDKNNEEIKYSLCTRYQDLNIPENIKIILFMNKIK